MPFVSLYLFVVAVHHVVYTFCYTHVEASAVQAVSAVRSICSVFVAC
jgi:hypothetical protein